MQINAPLTCQLEPLIKVHLKSEYANLTNTCLFALLQAQQKELQELRDSTSYRLGSHIVQSAAYVFRRFKK
jgi:hypothetical protein